MLSRLFIRSLHSSNASTARLVGSSLSVSPDFARTSAPPPPLPTIAINPQRPPRAPTPAATTLKPIRRATPSPADVAPDVLSWRLENRAARRGGAQQSPELARQEEDLQTAASLDLFLLRTLAQLSVQVGVKGDGALPTPRVQLTPLADLVKQRREKANAVVESATLPYEPTPPMTRRVRLDGRAGSVVETDASDLEQDGTVVVAHVLGGQETRVEVCSGFAVSSTGDGEGQVVLTCAHTLDGMERFLNSPSSLAAPSATLVLTSTGHVHSVTSVLSSLPGSDLLLLRLSPQPINPSNIPVRRLRTLPINPYPNPTGSGISVHRYLNPLARLRRKLQKLPEREWDEGVIVEYKDAKGRTAETGTYDELSQMWLSALPTPGSSGGPVVCRETGSVVGVTRGSSHKYGERQQYGFATPSEKILEMFTIPGFKTTAQRQAEREAAAAAAAAKQPDAATLSSATAQDKGNMK